MKKCLYQQYDRIKHMLSNWCDNLEQKKGRNK